MINNHNFTPPAAMPFLTPDAAAKMIEAIETFTEAAVMFLDDLEGDADADEDDAEDAFGFSALAEGIRRDSGPGCYRTEGADSAWLERVDQTTSTVKSPAHLYEPGIPEDAEADDDDNDQGEAEPDFKAIPKCVAFRYGPGCPISDADHGIEDLPQDDIYGTD